MTRTKRFVLLLVGGPLILLGTSCQKNSSAKPPDIDYYTCTMHPSVRKQNPHDKCPICSMDLVPVKKKGAQAETKDVPGLGNAIAQGEEPPTEFSVPIRRLQQIGVTYGAVEKRHLGRTIRAVGLVALDQERHWDYVARVEGYVQKLFVFSRGERVEKNGPLLTLYSPELLTTQNEFIGLLKAQDRARASGSKSILESTDRLIASAKERLRLWNISDEAIADLETTRKPQEQLTLYSPVRGVVRNLAVDQGKNVRRGDHLLDIADLSLVWVWVELYEDELPLVKRGLAVTLSTASYPGERFQGTISVVDPFINPALRTSRFRIDVENPGLKLRPDMYVDAELTIDTGEGLAVPVAAVLPTGTRNVVFLDRGEGKLEPRFVQLGRQYGDFYEVKAGLTESDRVVTSANFLVDAEAQVQGALRSW